MHSFGYVHNFNIFQLYHGLYDGFVWTFRDSFQLVAISMWKNEALYNIYNPTMCSFLSFNKRCMWLSPTPSLWSQSLPGPPTPFPRDLVFCNEEQGGRIWDWGKAIHNTAKRLQGVQQLYFWSSNSGKPVRKHCDCKRKINESKNPSSLPHWISQLRYWWSNHPTMNGFRWSQIYWVVYFPTA